MSAFLPPSTNDQYQGSRYAAWYLAFYGFAWIVPGMIHYFVPDGGAGTIAGLDLSHNPTMIFGMFAWAGATQIAHGTVTLTIALRYRTLVPLFLLVCLIERMLLSWSGWVKHVPISGHHPPGHYGSLISLPVILLFLWLSVRRSSPHRPETRA
jgi:DMSO/TMAO reductase YedYZ heme-binding membrane subunit